MSYAEEFPQLSNEIFQSSTFNTVIEVLPEFLFHKIRETDEYIDKSNSDTKEKKLIVKMKEIMEVELKCSIRDVDYYEALKEKQVAFGNVSASQSTAIPSQKKNGKSKRK